MEEENKAYMNVTQNKETKIAVLLITENINDKITQSFIQQFGIQFLSAEKTIVPFHKTEEGSVYKDLLRYEFKPDSDDFDEWWSVAKQVVRESISKSIGHIDN